MFKLSFITMPTRKYFRPIIESSLPDSTIPMFLDGYEFISKRCRHEHSNIFETRLLTYKVICMKGEEAARIFYDTNRFQRQGAMPNRGKETLVGKETIQGLDGEAHRHRKRMFMSLMSPERVQEIADIMTDHWRVYLHKWEKQERVEMFREVSEILCRTACAWAGVPIAEAEVGRRTEDFMAIIDSAPAVGLRHWRGRWARNRTDQWLANLIEAARAQTLEIADGSPLDIIAHFRDLDGEVLDGKVAAAELNSIIRPTIAVARFIVFEALALHEYPQYRQSLQTEGEPVAQNENYTAFVQEVRRFYPFFPVATAIVKREFEWQGHHFPKGRWVLLDLYGTNRDPQSWEQPDLFRPERFRNWDGSAFNFIPQGGGDHFQNHRCAGEWITISLMKAALRMLTQEMSYDVPSQDLTIDLARIPAIPESRFVIANVKGGVAAKPASGKKRKLDRVQ